MLTTALINCKPACQSPIPTGLKLQFTGRRRSVAYEQIARLEAHDNYTYCHFSDGTQMLVSITLKQMANRLYVRAIWQSISKAELSTGERLAISRRRLRTTIQTMAPARSH